MGEAIKTREGLENRIRSIESALETAILTPKQERILEDELDELVTALDDIEKQDHHQSEQYRPIKTIQKVQYNSESEELTIPRHSKLKSDLAYRAGMGIEATKQSNRFVEELTSQGERATLLRLVGEVFYFAVSRGIEAGGLLLASLISSGVRPSILGKKDSFPKLPKRKIHVEEALKNLRDM